jgi:hypothetical protein
MTCMGEKAKLLKPSSLMLLGRYSMRSELSVHKFDQGGASNAYLTVLGALMKSGHGGELGLDFFPPTMQTSGSSALAETLSQEMEMIELQLNINEIASFQLVKRPLFSNNAVLYERPQNLSNDRIVLSLRQVETQLRAMLEADPIEDGYSHTAEATLKKVIRDFGYHAGDWLTDMLSTNCWNPSLRAGLLRLLSRQKPLTKEWRLRVVQIGLLSPNLELRDAAVQAAESWEDEGVDLLLHNHIESCTWLADYISRVIRDLSR